MDPNVPVPSRRGSKHGADGIEELRETGFKFPVDEEDEEESPKFAPQRRDALSGMATVNNLEKSQLGCK